MRRATRDSASTPPSSSVRTLARHTVHCADARVLRVMQETEVWKLGPFDQLVPAVIPVAVVFVYRAPSSATPQQQLMPISRLQRALSRLLDFYPHLMGRLHVHQQDHTTQVNRLGSGVELFESLCSCKLDDLLSSDAAHLAVTDLPDGGNALLAPYVGSLDAVCEGAMFTLQHTRFACGSVALGVRVPHCVCDAHGLFLLMNDLASLYRQSKVTSDDELDNDLELIKLTQPVITHSFLHDFSESISGDAKQKLLQFQPSSFQLSREPDVEANEESGSSQLSAINTTAVAPVIGRVLHFTSRELSALKAHASAKQADGNGWISTFSALAAHLHQRTYAARVQLALDRGQDPASVSSDFLAPVNLRALVGLTSRYFPNALICSILSFPSKELALAPLARVAETVHKAVRSLDATEAINTLHWMAVQPDKSRIVQAFNADGGLMISSWASFDTFVSFDDEMDGSPLLPILVSTPFTPISLIDGLAYVMPVHSLADDKNAMSSHQQRHTHATLDVNFALSEPVWQILDRDPEFRRFA